MKSLFCGYCRRETDATIVHTVRRRSIRYGPDSESSGTSSHGSDVMVEVSDVSSTCIMVTGDEATINQTQEPLQTETDHCSVSDNLASEDGKQIPEENVDKIDHSGKTSCYAISTADEECILQQQASTDKETSEAVINITAAMNEGAETQSSQSASNCEVPATCVMVTAPTQPNSMQEKEKEDERDHAKDKALRARVL